jgi:6-phosphogluconate dehydrogenase (decarboxylating)
LGYNNSKVINRGLVEKTFFWFEIEVETVEAGENFMGQALKGREVRVKKEDIIQIYNEMSVINEVLKDVCHKGLKSSKGIAKAKGHNKGFKEAKFTLKGGFPLITSFDLDIIVFSMNVELCKVAG